MKRKGRTFLILAVVLAALAWLRPVPLALEMAADAKGAHALVRLGFATVRFAFDSGQECSEADICGRVRLGAGW